MPNSVFNKYYLLKLVRLIHINMLAKITKNLDQLLTS